MWARVAGSLQFVGQHDRVQSGLGWRSPQFSAISAINSGTQVSAENVRSSSRRDGLAVSQSTKPTPGAVGPQGVPSGEASR
jgi:hypothetical protein